MQDRKEQWEETNKQKRVIGIYYLEEQEHETLLCWRERGVQPAVGDGRSRPGGRGIRRLWCLTFTAASRYTPYRRSQGHQKYRFERSLPGFYSCPPRELVAGERDLNRQGQELHEQIAEAIARRDADQAQDLTRRVLEISTGRIQELLENERQTH